MATKTSSGRATGRSTARSKQKKPSPIQRIAQALRAIPSKVGEHLGDHKADVWGVVLIASGALTFLSFFDLSGPIGSTTSAWTRFLVGMWTFVVPFVLIAAGLAMIGLISKDHHARTISGLVFLFVGSLALFHLMTGNVPIAGSDGAVGENGGVVGSIIAYPLERLVGYWGAFVVLVAVIGVGALLVTRSSLGDVVRSIAASARGSWSVITSLKDVDEAEGTEIIVDLRDAEPVQHIGAITPPADHTDEPAPERTRRKPVVPKVPAPLSSEGYQLPPLEILELSGATGHDGRGLKETGEALEGALLQHGVDAKLVRIVPGPTVTRYEIELAPGVKVNRITNLSNDIAYALATADVRILAPIPGKSAIGVEVPNRKRKLVTIGDVLTSEIARTDHDPMLVSLGVDVSGTARMLRLTELPHVLIAGATGAGKSSCINSLLTSILMRATPEEVRLILVDPKRVELGQYNDAPHLLTRVITNPKKAADALQWAVAEMDRRYELLADAGVRDIDSYREQYDAGGLDEEMFDRFPYIVIVVDELNDLMMVAGRVVEDSIVRIAQMARAVGIHLVLATQRPSVNVITGVIKANVPSRLAFSVASQTDSRVIIDQGGADKLVGLGDMLVVTARDPKPERIQGSFVSEHEIHAVVGWVRDQREARYRDTEVFEQAQQRAADVDEFDGEDPEIMREAIDLVVRSQLGSTSMLQRKLRIGFARAGRVMDILEARGVVGPSEGSKARAVLITED
ncbi:MAG TPA: DNA translocase FtsK 4TM domain-containing protein, partial [Acidimicrobiia bacterium]|nr:DNA translocase FtsK 4TM domain-containing protein [Acidimicrobiia bacterium]